MLKRALGATILAMALTWASPARADTDGQSQIWAATLMQVKLGSLPLKLWFDGHGRRGPDNTVLIMRPGLGWIAAKNLVLWAGYAWVPVFNDGSTARHEHRFWQQLTYKLPFSKSLWSSFRFRFEQRLLEGVSGVALRARGFAALRFNLGGPLLLALWDEIFFNLNSPNAGPDAGFDQNRIFAGLGLKGFKGMRVEVGYLNVFLERGEPDTLQHNLAVNLFLSF